MKKNLLIVVFFVTLLTNATAQTQKRKAKYQGEVFAGYAIGIGALSYDRIHLHTIHGVRFNDYFSFGLGLGVDYFYKYDVYVDPDLTASELTMPIYLNTRGYLPVSEKTSLFLNLDFGVGLGLTAGVSGLKGVYFQPAVGASFRVSRKNALNLSFGYNYQAWSESGFKVNMDAISLRIGFQF